MKKFFVLLTMVLLAFSAAWAAKRPVPFYLVNNSCFNEDEIYIGIVGQKKYGDVAHSIYYNLSVNSAGNSGVSDLNDGLNTLHKTGGDWGYANIFYKMSQLPTLNGQKVVYMDNTFGCRMFIAFKSPMYLHAFADGGYAGADYNNPGDPNYNVRCELIEFTVDWIDGEDRNGIWVNTTRVDTFQYPMGLELFGESNATVKYIKTGELVDYNTVINRWTSQHSGDVYNNCKINNVTTDNLGPIIMQPSKVGAVKSSNIFGSYINSVWDYYKSNTINVTMGVLGRWTGRVEGDDTFTLTCVEGEYWKVGSVAKIYGRPTTEDVIEGAGKFADGNDIDKTVQAMFCGAMNRGVIKNTTAHQSWSPTDSRYFNEGNTCNEYVKFFHQTDLSFEGRTYAFAYDDTYDQSATCTTSHADHVVVTIGGFKGATDIDVPTGGGGGNDQPTGSFSVSAAAPAPGVAADKVVSLYSDSYQSILGGDYSFLEAWGQTTSVAKQNVGGNNYLHYSNANYIGWAFDNRDLTGYNTLHLDIYPAASGSLKVLPIHRAGSQDDDVFMKTVNVTGGKWNSIDIPYSDFGGLDFSGISQFKLADFSGFNEFAIDNVYFYAKSGNTTGGGGSTGSANGTVGNGNFDITYNVELSNGALVLNVTSLNNKNNIGGVVPQININNAAFHNLVDNGNGTYTHTESGSFAAGQTIPAFFYIAHSQGADRIDFDITIPSGGTQGGGTSTEPDPGADYTLVWSDEFDGNALDETRWNIEVNGDGGGNNELQYYTRDGVSVSNGNLVLTATRRNYSNKSFTSGRLTTQNKVYFKYGKVDARIKLPKTYKGLWPAFWTMGNDISNVGWPACGELDILEMGNGAGYDSPSHAECYLNGACHWNDNGHAQYGSYEDGNMRGTYYKSVQDGQYHNFTLEWTPELITCYIDGDTSRPYFAFANNHNAAVESSFFSKPFFVLFNLAVGGDFTGIHDPAAITAIGPNQGDSQSMYVDYVRVYQRSDNGSTITDNGGGSVTPPADGFNVSAAAPAPSAAAANVKSLYSDSYQGVLGSDYSYLEAWGQATSVEKKSVSGNNYLAYSNTDYIGWGFSSQNYSDMSALHLDIYPAASGSIQVLPIHKTGGIDDDVYAKTVNVTAGKWNSIDIPLSDFGGQDFSDISQFKFFNLSGFKAFALDNVYFYKNSSTNGGGNGGGNVGGNENLDPNYKLVWSDEFDGNALDETRWNIEVNGDGGGNSELQYYTRDGVSVSNGNLVLTATRRNYQGKGFTSGRVNSQGKVYFTYGKIEASIKLPKSYKGLWPAFWTMGNDFPSVGWPQCGELDILEMGEKAGFDTPSHAESYMNGACHWWNVGTDGAGYAGYSSYMQSEGMKGSYYKSVQDGQYHKFTLEWTPELISCYIDDDTTRPYFEFANDKSNASVDGTFFSKPYFLLFNLAVGGKFPDIYDPAGITAIGPNQGDSESMYIDYVRVYQRESDGGVLIDKAANNVQATTSTTAHNFSGTQYFVVNLDDATINQKLAGKQVVDVRPNDDNRNFYIWENTLTGNEINGTNMYGAQGGFVDMTVANNVWYGMGYDMQNVNLSGLDNNSMFHFDLKIPQGGMANFFITVSGVDFKVGTDSDAHLKATINDGQWHGFDVPVSFFGVVPSTLSSFKGNLVSVHGYESMQGKSFQLGGIYFYNNGTSQGGGNDNPGTDPEPDPQPEPQPGAAQTVSDANFDVTYFVTNTDGVVNVYVTNINNKNNVGGLAPQISVDEGIKGLGGAGNGYIHSYQARNTYLPGAEIPSSFYFAYAGGAATIPFTLVVPANTGVDHAAPEFSSCAVASAKSSVVKLNVKASDAHADRVIYNIYNGDTQIKSMSAANGQAVTVTVGGLLPNTEYNFYVEAMDPAGNKTAAKQVSAKTTNFTLVWSDEFDNNTLGTNWTVETGTGDNGWGNWELENYTDREKNVAIKDGNLVLTAIREDYQGSNFTSGRLKSLNKVYFTHGKIEARIKLPHTSRGLWPAFWMMGNDIDTHTWPACGEVDILEAGHSNGFGGNEDKYFSGCLHWGADWNGHQYWESTTVTPYSAQDDYHTFSCVWDEDYMKFYLDGATEPYYAAAINKDYDPYISSDEYMHKPYFILFNLAVGGMFPGISDASGITALPNVGDEASMLIDYVRIYQDDVNVVCPSSANDKGTVTDKTAPAISSASLSGTTVTVSGTDNSGTVVYTVLNDGKPAGHATAKSGEAVQIAIGGLSAGETYGNVKVVASDLAGNKAERSLPSVTVAGSKTPTVAAPQPKVKAEDVVASIYSDAFGNAGNLNARADWYIAPDLNEKSVNGDNYLNYSGYMGGAMGWEFDQINASGADYFHFDVWTSTTGAISLSPVTLTADGGVVAKVGRTAEAGKWVSVDIPVSEITSCSPKFNLASIAQIAVGNFANQTEFSIDNVYFYKGAAQPEPQPSMVAAPVPTVKAERVISLYSDSYQFAPASLSSYNEGWGQSTKLSDEQISGNNYLSYTDFNYIGWQFAEVDASEMEYVHIDVYPKSDGMINIVPIYGGDGKTTDDKHKVRLDLTAGKWNSFNIPVSQFSGLDFSSIFQMKFDGDGSVQEFAIDNVYFYRTYDPVVAEVFVDGTAYNGTAHTASELNYKRAAAETGVWTPWYVPFETSVNELKDNGLDAAFVSGVHQYDDDQNGTLDRTVVEVIYLRNGNLLANYPYLVMAKSSSRDIDMTLYNVDMKAANDGETVNLATALVDYTISGTHQGISQSECNAQGYLVPGMMDSKTAGFVAPTNGVKPQSWVLSLKTKKFPYQIEQSLAKRIFIEVIGEEDIVTGIRTIYPKEEQTVEGIYDLSGRRLSSPVKGVNIINGKKVSVK